MAKRWFSGVVQVRDERPLAAVPRPIRRALMLVLLVQVAFHAMAPSPDASVEALRAPPERHIHEVSALGEPVFVAKLTNLWLQAHDHQPGVSIPYAHLDYQRVRAWLARILALDARGQYPLMAASRLYGALRHPLKQRVMFEFVHAEFRKDPGRAILIKADNSLHYGEVRAVMDKLAEGGMGVQLLAAEKIKAD